MRIENLNIQMWLCGTTFKSPATSTRTVIHLVSLISSSILGQVLYQQLGINSNQGVLPAPGKPPSEGPQTVLITPQFPAVCLLVQSSKLPFSKSIIIKGIYHLALGEVPWNLKLLYIKSVTKFKSLGLRSWKNTYQWIN